MSGQSLHLALHFSVNLKLSQNNKVSFLFAVPGEGQGEDLLRRGGDRGMGPRKRWVAWTGREKGWRRAAGDQGGEPPHLPGASESRRSPPKAQVCLLDPARILKARGPRRAERGQRSWGDREGTAPWGPRHRLQGQLVNKELGIKKKMPSRGGGGAPYRSPEARLNGTKPGGAAE